MYVLDLALDGGQVADHDAVVDHPELAPASTFVYA